MRRMKDSGIEWIGEIPEVWETTILSALFSERKRKNVGMQEKNLLSLSYGKIIKKNIQSREGLLPASFETYNIIEPGNIVFRLTDLQNDQKSLRTGLCSENGIITSAYVTIQTKEGDCPRYMHYLFHAYDMLKVFYSMGDGVRQGMVYADLRRLKVIRPFIDEQIQIADYLDRKCAQIDAVIARQEAVIKKLKEYKLSLITEAVTRGLNPDATMKDSGVEWAGDIPMHWKTSKISRVSVTSSGATPLRGRQSEYFDDADIRWVRTLDLNDWFVLDSSEKITETALLESSCSVMPTSTVCVAMYGGAGTIGKCGMLVNPSATNQAVCSIVCGKSVFPEYMLFQLLALKKYWMKFAVGTRKDPNISQDTVGRMRILVPSYKEQEAIAAYLKEKCQDLDDVVKKKQSLIDRLTSYKKSLIYEVVTGKREVPA